MLSIFDQGLVLEEHDRPCCPSTRRNYPQDRELLLQRLREAVADESVLRSSMADMKLLPRNS